MGAEVTDAEFLKLTFPSYTFAETTPEVADEFRGIRIAAPKRVIAGAGARIPVSAVARFAEESAHLPKPLWDSVAAIVVEISANRCWVGSLLDPNAVPEPMPTGKEAEEAAGGDDEGEEAEPESAKPAPAEAHEPEEDLEELDVGGVANMAAHVDLRELLELPGTPGSYEISLTWGPWASNTVRVVVERPREGE